MDIDLPPVPAARKKKGAVTKMADTLKARIAAAKTRLAAAPAKGGKGATATKAADIKITISGNARAGTARATAGKGRGRGIGRGAGRGGGRGGIVKPGKVQATGRMNLAGAIGKKKPKAKTVVIVGARGNKNKAAKGGGRGAARGRGRGAGRAGLTLAQRFGRR